MTSHNKASSAVRQIQQTVFRMLNVIEEPGSTEADRVRACSTIRDAFNAHSEPNQYGMNLAEYELSAAANNAESDRLFNELESQETAFASKLRELMQRFSVTQKELAFRIGCTQPAISQMLKRQCRPQRSTIVSMAHALNVDPRELWPDLAVADILDTVAALQESAELSKAEATALRKTLEGPVASAPASPLPRRKKR